jgi:hypothetical protein
MGCKMGQKGLLYSFYIILYMYHNAENVKREERQEPIRYRPRRPSPILRRFRRFRRRRRRLLSWYALCLMYYFLSQTSLPSKYRTTTLFGTNFAIRRRGDFLGLCGDWDWDWVIRTPISDSPELDLERQIFLCLVIWTGNMLRSAASRLCSSLVRQEYAVC